MVGAPIRARVDALQKVVTCSERGQMRGSDGNCTDIIPLCTDLPALPKGATLVFPGDAVPGTRGRVVCSSKGEYDASDGSTCLRNGSWSAVAVKCTKCSPECSECSGPQTCTACGPDYPNLKHGRCIGNDGLSKEFPLTSCRIAKESGFSSGLYFLKSADGRVYQAFCMNGVINGWNNAYGGGWEILHTQIGGYNLPSSPKSNRAMRSNPPSDVVGLPELSDRRTHKSQMSRAFLERAQQNGWQWIKFMAKFQDNTLKGQDTNMVSLPRTMNWWWFYDPKTSKNNCKKMPGQAIVTVNGKDVGQTDRAVYHSGLNSIGLANKDNDQCGQVGVIMFLTVTYILLLI